VPYEPAPPIITNPRRYYDRCGPIFLASGKTYRHSIACNLYAEPTEFKRVFLKKFYDYCMYSRPIRPCRLILSA